LGQRRVGGTRHGHWVMSLHKLTAGDGYTYLTRQVAAADATHRGRGGLGEYYSQRGESPGLWMGHGAGGLTEFLAPTEAAAAAVRVRAAGAAGAFRGAAVSETQMLALFGQGRHPNAEAIEKAMITGGQGVRAVLSATRLGVPYKLVKGPSAFRVELARRFEHTNAAAGLPRDWPVPEAERAAIRTALGREMFTVQYGRAPSNSRELSGFLARAMRQQSTAVAGYDLTFTPVKSVSALWALAPRDVAQVIEQAHQAAVEQCLSWLEDGAANPRGGRGGARQVDVRGLIAAAFTHRDSRAGDPNLHTHVAVSNKVQAVGGQADGRWLALDGRPLHKLAVAASERYNTRLEALLRDRLGVEFTERATEPGKRAVREIVGVDERLLMTWSARRLMIEVRRGELAGQFQTRHGRPPGPIEAVKLAQQATLETRQAKHQPRSHAEQRRTWRAEALGVLGTPQALAAMVDGALQGLRKRSSTRHDRTLDTPGWVAGTAEQVLATVSSSRATWQQAHIRAEAERAVRTANLPLARVDAAVEAIVAAALSPASSLPLGMPEPVSEPAALRRRDGTSVYTTAGAQLFTSPRVVAAEQALLALARRTGGRTVSAESIELALLEAAARAVVLNPGQVAMVREFTGSAQLLQLALAPAGTGKTVTMSVVARAWKGDGGNVIGLAPSAAAAALLGQELSGAGSGSVHSDTLAKREGNQVREQGVQEPLDCGYLTRNIGPGQPHASAASRCDHVLCTLHDQTRYRWNSFRCSPRAALLTGHRGGRAAIARARERRRSGPGADSTAGGGRCVPGTERGSWERWLPATGRSARGGRGGASRQVWSWRCCSRSAGSCSAAVPSTAAPYRSRSSPRRRSRPRLRRAVRSRPPRPRRGCSRCGCGSSSCTSTRRSCRSWSRPAARWVCRPIPGPSAGGPADHCPARWLGRRSSTATSTVPPQDRVRCSPCDGCRSATR